MTAAPDIFLSYNSEDQARTYGCIGPNRTFHHVQTDRQRLADSSRSNKGNNPGLRSCELLRTSYAPRP